ncbi:MAG: branched chain amino acid aminotransferase [Planctomycetota bacterium]|nr:MAG: branched chain amino acid aminotransferase [Planctomycetota bacterium]
MSKQLCEKIWRNGEFINWADATVHICTHAIHYGSAVFEGIRCYELADGKSGIFRLREHVRRLYDSARIYRMEIRFPQEEVIRACVEAVRVNRFKACYLRPIVYRDFGPMGVNPLKNPVSLDIITWDWGKYLGDEALEKGVDMMISSWQRNTTNSTPSIAKCASNYASGALIKMEALSNGYSEGIALDAAGMLSEGSGENIFVVRDGVINTPGIGHSILSGITRDTVMRLARDMSIQVVERTIARAELYTADEVFACGTAAEITPIRSLDKITIGTGVRGPVTGRIQKAYLDLVTGRSEDKWNFVTRV